MAVDSVNGSSLPHALPLDSRSSAAVIVQAASMVVIIIVAIAGNVLILAAIYIDKTLQTITNAFIINLACADLLLAIIGMPFTLASSITYEWIFGDTWCHVNGMSNSLFCIASILTLAAVSVDRYFAILHPFRYGTWITKKVAAGMILYIWFHALLMAALPVMGWSKYTFLRSESICTVEWGHDVGFTLFLFTVCFFLPLGIMMFTYFKIFRTARIHSKRIVPVTGQIESKEEPSVSGPSQTNASCFDYDPATSNVLNKSCASFSSSMYSEALTLPHLPDHKGQREFKIIVETEYPSDPPSKDSGFEEIYPNTPNLSKVDDPTMAFTSTVGSYKRVVNKSDLNSSYESMNFNEDKIMSVSMEAAISYTDCAQDVLTPRDFKLACKVPFASLNDVGKKRKSGVAHLTPLPPNEMYGKSDLADQNLNTSQQKDKAEQNSTNNTILNPSAEALGFRTDSADYLTPRSTSAVVSQSLPRIAPFASRRREQSEMADSTSVVGRQGSAKARKKKISTGSLANFIAPNVLRAFSKSSIALNKLRKKKEVQNRAKMRRETKAAKTLLIVVGTFVLCWTPHFIGIFCLLFDKCSWPEEFFAITTWLAMLNSACNPVIYGVMSRQFRARFKQILQCKKGFF